MRIDGLYEEQGAVDCATMAIRYRNWVEKRLNSTGGVSPVEITGHWIPGPDEIVIEATFRLVDPIILSDLRATLLLLENDVYQVVGPTSPTVWNNVTRAIHDDPIVLDSVGSEVTLTTTVSVDGYWDLDQLHAVAYLQQTTEPRPVIQGAPLDLRPDFWFDPPLVRSVPGGQGVALFSSSLTNTGTTSDFLTLSIAETFGDWPTELIIQGDPVLHTDPVVLELNPGASREITLRVGTNAMKEIRTGRLEIRSTASGRTQTSHLRLWNGSPSIFLVDDDAGQADETAFVDALVGAGYLHDSWDVFLGHGDETPDFRELTGFDVVIWSTGWSSWLLLSGNDQAAMTSLLDQGGSLFFCSQEYLDWLFWSPNTFTEQVLGITGWDIDMEYEHLTGVPDDPIGDGLDLPLGFPSPDYKEGDDLVPGPSASAILNAEEGSIAAVRHERQSGGRVVFMASAFNGIDEAAADPNNQRTVLDRIVTWLTEGVPASAESEITWMPTTSFSAIAPNPFNPRTEISFLISRQDAGSPLRLEVIDTAGRSIATLFDGLLPEGMHVRSWAGRAKGGRSIDSGVYFTRLTSRSGHRSAKLVLLK